MQREKKEGSSLITECFLRDWLQLHEAAAELYRTNAKSYSSGLNKSGDPGQQDLGSRHSVRRCLVLWFSARQQRFRPEYEDGHKTKSRALAELAPFKEPFWKPHPLPSPCMLLAGAVLYEHPWLKGTGKCMLHQTKFKFCLWERRRERTLDRQPGGAATNEQRWSQLCTSFPAIYKTEAFCRASLLVFSSQAIIVNTYF